VLTGTGLPAGERVEGPAVVEFPETTCLVPPGWSGTADDHGVFALEAT
jgi:N-methylhydantoinase A